MARQGSANKLSKQSYTHLALIRYRWIFANITTSATCRPIFPKSANWFSIFCDGYHIRNSSQGFFYFHASERIFWLFLMKNMPNLDDLVLSVH